MTPAVRRYLEAERARLERATPWPWGQKIQDEDDDGFIELRGQGSGGIDGEVALYVDPVDAALIVAAVNDRRAVLRLVEAVARHIDGDAEECNVCELEDALAALVGEDSEKTGDER